MYGPDDFYGGNDAYYNGHKTLNQQTGPVEKPIADFFKRKIEDKKFVDDPEGGVQPVVESYFKKVEAKHAGQCHVHGDNCKLVMTEDGYRHVRKRKNEKNH